MDGGGLFAGRRGGQIASRYTLIPTQPFAYRAPAEQRCWQALVATLEQSLRLHAHRADTLLGLDAYLHQRTGGMIGSLSQLIREAAIDAITDGTEKITRKGLDNVDLDEIAENQDAQRKRARTARHAKRAIS